MIKVKFIMAGQDDWFMCNRIAKNFIYSENENKEIQLTYSNDYDYLVACNSNVQRVHPKEKTIGIIMEPSWSSNWNRNLAKECSTLIVHDNTLFNFTDTEVIERPSLMFTEFYNSPQQVNFFLEGNKPKKGKINMIISGLNRAGNNLYPKRLALVDAMTKANLPIDIYGRGLTPDGKHIKGPFDKKLDVLDCEFSIAIENSRERNYVSEKFFDPILMDSVTVYHGCPNVEEIYGKDCFIPLNLDDIDSCLSLMESLLTTSRMPYLGFLKEAKLKYFRENNLYTEICKIIAKKENL